MSRDIIKTKMASSKKRDRSGQAKWPKQAEVALAAAFREQESIIKPQFTGSVTHDKKKKAWEKIVQAVNR